MAFDNGRVRDQLYNAIDAALNSVAQTNAAVLPKGTDCDFGGKVRITRDKKGNISLSYRVTTFFNVPNNPEIGGPASKVVDTKRAY